MKAESLSEHMAQSEINHLLKPREESAANQFKKIPSFPEAEHNFSGETEGRAREGRERENAGALEGNRNPMEEEL